MSVARSYRTGGTRGKPKSDRRRGSELVEGMLMLLPFLALVFIIIDTSYGIFLQSELQSAVQAGANYAATDTTGGLVSGIQSAVETQSLNLVPAGNVTVNFYAPTDMTAKLPTGSGVPNLAGNVVEVDAQYLFTPLAPLFRSSAAITLTASASTVLAASPAPSL